jgi:hypothetical protein
MRAFAPRDFRFSGKSCRARYVARCRPARRRDIDERWGNASTFNKMSVIEKYSDRAATERAWA